MKRIIFAIFFIFSLIICESVTVFADDNHFTVTFSSSDINKGNFYDEKNSQYVDNLEFTLEINDESGMFYENPSTYTVGIYDGYDTIARFTPKSKEGYVFLQWTINDEILNLNRAKYFRDYQYENIEVVAHYVKNTKFYWALGVDDLSQFNPRDPSILYSFVIAEDKNMIDNYENLLNYQYRDIPFPLAGETNGYFDSRPNWGEVIIYANKVSVLGDIEVVKTSNWFANADMICEDFELNLDGLHGVQNISNMFNRCNNVKSINIINFDTSEVTNMSSMFSDSNSIESILFDDSFDTSKVKMFSNMFNNCRGLKYIDIDGFNTSKAVNMSHMFAYTSIEEIDLSNFNTSNVTDMSYMFNECQSLSTLNVSNFDTSNVTNMSSMFSWCKRLTTLDLTNFVTSNVSDMSNMFDECTMLETLDVSSFDTSNVTNYDEMFEHCYSLSELDITNFKHDPLIPCSVRLMFASMYNVERIYASPNFDLSNTYDNSDGCFGWKYGSESFYSYCNNLRGAQGSYIADPPVGDDVYPSKNDDPYCMFNTYGQSSIYTKFAHIDDYDHGNPGYFTWGTHIIYKYDDGTEKKVVCEVGKEIELEQLEKPGYTFMGWSDGESVYDNYVLDDEDIILEPVWRKDVIIEQTIDDVVYNGNKQYPLPRGMGNLSEDQYNVTYTKINENSFNTGCLESGTYQCDIEILEKGYYFSEEKETMHSFEFKIAKRPLIINIDSKSIYLNDLIPPFSFTPSGLVDGHKIDIKLIGNVDSKTLGTYVVSKQGDVKVFDENDKDVTKNYIITINNGTFIVKKHSSSSHNSYSIPKTGIK